ncbi:hypothetical protein PV939_12240, partial [Ligilactobacillus salivarius]|nr:hypothetical protein [Ligilactobacillus salivarius]
GNGAPDGSGFMGFYHQNLGGIPLPIKSTPPTTPEIHYHLDSSLLCALFLVLFVFKLYFQFCNIIINFYYC